MPEKEKLKVTINTDSVSGGINFTEAGWKDIKGIIEPLRFLSDDKIIITLERIKEEE
jgi:hypothetical protein